MRRGPQFFGVWEHLPATPGSELPDYLMGFLPQLVGYSVTRLARPSVLFLDCLGLRSVFRFRPGCSAGTSRWLGGLGKRSLSLMLGVLGLPIRVPYMKRVRRVP